MVDPPSPVGRHRARESDGRPPFMPSDPSRRRETYRMERRTRRRVANFVTIATMMLSQAAVSTSLAVGSTFSVLARILLGVFAAFGLWAAVVMIRETSLAHREVEAASEDARARSIDSRNPGGRDDTLVSLSGAVTGPIAIDPGQLGVAGWFATGPAGEQRQPTAQ